MPGERTLTDYFRPFLSRFLLACFFMLMVALFTTLLGLVIQPVFDEMLIQSSSDKQAFAAHLPAKSLMVRDFVAGMFHLQSGSIGQAMPLLLLIVFAGQGLFSFLSLYMMKTLGLKVVRNIRDQIYRQLIHQSVDFLAHSKTGDLVSRISNDIERIKSATSETLAVYIRETLTIVGLIVVIFYWDWKMAAASLLLFPLVAPPLAAFARKVKKRGLQSQETIGELSNFLAESVTGNRIVKAFNMEEYEINKFRQLNQRHFRINAKIALLYSLAAPVMDIVGGLVAAGLFIVGIHRIGNHTMTPGQFASFLASLFLMYSPIKRLSQAHNDYQQGKASFERVRQIMAAPNTVRDRTSAMELKSVRGEVEFRNISFAYTPGVPVLRNISFSARPNEVVALVGTSGAGKTTIMSLLLRFYDPDSGDVTIDGRDIRSFTQQSLREQIGLVTQDVFLFNDTVLNNIAYGRKRYTRESVKRAAQIARAADFIEQLPQGYDTVVGERGALLSTGQRQRISIARAILKQPPILIFDEATSSLDSESESLIQEAITEVMKQRTTFVIAHRLSTIIEADRILVIEKGEIKENGSHRELIKKRGLYYQLYNLQFPEMGIIM
jgi:ATP-binding cassette, subfamily B, bacterial MsbA